MLNNYAELYVDNRVTTRERKSWGSQITYCNIGCRKVDPSLTFNYYRRLIIMESFIHSANDLKIQHSRENKTAYQCDCLREMHNILHLKFVSRRLVGTWIQNVKCVVRYS